MSSSDRPTPYRSPFARLSPASPTPSRSLKHRSASAMSLGDFLSSRSCPLRSQRSSYDGGYSDGGSVKQTQRSDSPPTGHLFDSNNTLSFSDGGLPTTNDKLPVPLVGAALMKAQQRNSAESDVVALDVKPSVFLDPEDQRDQYFDDDESELPGGYSDNGYYDNSVDGYGDQDHDYNFPADEEGGSEKSEDDDDDTLQQRGLQAPGGLWQDDATAASSLFDKTVGNDAFVQTGQQLPAPVWQSKGKEVQTREQPAQASYSTTIQPFHRPIIPFRVPRAPLAPPQAAYPNKPLRLGPPKPQPGPEDPDRTIRPAVPASPISPSPPPPPPPLPVALAATPYLSVAELRAIPTYTTLLTHLSERYSSSRSSPADLEAELRTLLQYDYPTRSLERPTRLFDALPDEAYDAAGALIVAKMAELQERIREAARKRRKVAEDRFEMLRPVANEREEKLRLLVERGEVLRGGVGRLLAENGFLT